jgi:MFS family permease
MHFASRWASRTPFYYGWVVVMASGFAQFNGSAIAISTFSIFVPELQQEFGWSRTTISAAAAAATIFSAFAAPLAGIGADRYGGRWMLGIGGFAIGIALLGLGFAQNLLMFYAFFVIGRIVMLGTVQLTVTTVVANWFIRKRALAIAISGTASRVSQGIWPGMAGLLFSVVGWRGVWWIWGSWIMATSLIPILLIPSRRPDDIGLLPDGAQSGVNDESGPETAASMEVSWTPGQAVRSTIFWLLAVTTFCMSTVSGGLNFHRVSLFVDKGMSIVQGGGLLTVYSIGLTIGGFLFVWLTRYHSLNRVIALGMVLQSGMMYALWLIPGGGLAFGYMFFEGLLSGGTFTMIQVLYPALFGRTHIGTIRGIIQPIGNVSLALGPVMTSLMFDAAGGSYVPALFLFSGMWLAGAVAVSFATVRPPPSLSPPSEASLGPSA